MATPRALWLAGLTLTAALLAVGCGSGGATPTATAKSTATVPAAPGGSLRPLDGGGSPAPSTPATPAPIPSAVTESFPGLPLDKVQAMNYNPDQKRLLLVTFLDPGDAAGGNAVCAAFIKVALFDPAATIAVVASDYSPLATCAK